MIRSNMKVRTILATGGLLMGLAGIAALTWSAILFLFLVPVMGAAGAAALVGGGISALSAFALWSAFRPSVPVEQELSGLTALASDTIVRIKSDTIESLAERSLGTLNKMVDEQPLPVLLGVAVAAYVVARAPQATSGVFDRVLTRLL